MVGADIPSADFRCRNPFRLFVKERFLFDWERKYTSHFQNSYTLPKLSLLKTSFPLSK